MPDIRKLRIRTAQRIRDQLHLQRCLPPIPTLPADDWEHCRRLSRQFQEAQARGWNYASAIIRERYHCTFHRLVDNLREQTNQFLTGERYRALPELRQISDELASLEQEYDDVRIDLDRSTLSVVTERIILEEVDLGPFEIRLHWNRFGQRRPYETVALTPNPARGDEDVTHPHVQSGALCEGEGHVAIGRALRDGRLSDFFAIVNRVLHTYSPASPYVPLDQWTGVTCADCGIMTDEDDASTCTRCGDNLCLDCRNCCEQCGCDCCNSCLGSCRTCDAALCSTCHANCAHCGKRCCNGCLSNGELCEECQDNERAESEDSSEETISTGPMALPAIPGASPETSPAPGTPL